MSLFIKDNASTCTRHARKIAEMKTDMQQSDKIVVKELSRPIDYLVLLNAVSDILK
jgi:hypothetical protein